jgi:hypothetical protein
MTRFEFMDCRQLVQILGLRADDEQELAELLAEVPRDSVYHHTHGHFLRHEFVGAPYPNDFATWAVIQVRDRALGERLAVVSPLDHPTLEDLRQEILGILDDHLSRLNIVPRVIFGEAFEFMQSRVVEVSTGIAAESLAEFRKGVATVPASALYFHAIESARRLPHLQTDFTVWLRDGLGLTELAAAVGRLDPYAGSLERLRAEIVHLCDAALAADAAVSVGEGGSGVQP